MKGSLAALLDGLQRQELPSRKGRDPYELLDGLRGSGPHNGKRTGVQIDELLAGRGGKRVPTDSARILGLPYRELDLEDVPDLTDRFALPGGTMRLRPVQSAMLAEAERSGGLVALVGVGWGKTGVCFLLPTVLGAERPLLLIPASMRPQCIRDHAIWREHFEMFDGLVLRSYEQLSSPLRSDMLKKLSPDLLILDEAHKARHTDSVRSGRLRRYLRNNPSTRVAVLSGTLSTRSIKDYHHLCRWALRGGSPLPLLFQDLQSWSHLLDVELPEDTAASDADRALFAPVCAAMGEEHPRKAFRKRLVGTPGVVATSAQGVGASLLLVERAPKVPPSVQEMLRDVVGNWETPSGESLQDGLAMSKVLRELICGFYYYWDWSGVPWDGVPDEGWLEARKVWHKAVRTTLQQCSVENFDSPMLLALGAKCAFEGGSSHIRYKGESIEIPSALVKAWEQWVPHRDKPTPPTLHRWISTYLVEDAICWARAQSDPGLIWYSHAAFAERLVLETGWRHYGPGPEASRALSCVETIAPAVISIPAHGGGKNLQAWGNQLVANPLSNGALWEQLLGRTHRSGQLRDEVWATAYTHEIFDEALEAARKDARFVQETTGQMQRLCYASVRKNPLDAGEPA